MDEPVQLKLVPPTGEPPPEPPRKPIRDPVMACAVARCMMAQMRQNPPNTHPGPCPYCRIPLQRKNDALVEFNTWRDQMPRPTVQAFEEIPPEEQRLLIGRHMGYTVGEDGSLSADPDSPHRAPRAR